MHLDNFAEILPEKSEKSDSSPLALFGKSAWYELHQSAFGLAQTVGLESHLGAVPEPEAADSAVGRNLQMIGRGAGSFLPTIAVAVATKFALGRILHAPSAEAAESLLLKRSVIGLNMAESAVTGVVTGSLLKPTDEGSAKNWASFVADRAAGGLTNGLSFAGLTLTTFAINRLASTELFSSIGAEGLLKSAPVSGFVSGAAGGVIIVELNSLVNDKKFTTDGGKIYNSVYESAVVGGFFGVTAKGLQNVRGFAEQTAIEPSTELSNSQQASLSTLRALCQARLQRWGLAFLRRTKDRFEIIIERMELRDCQTCVHRFNRHCWWADDSRREHARYVCGSANSQALL